MIVCDVTDEELGVWEEGGNGHLDEHVAGCAHCQDRLALWWDDGERLKVTEPTMLAVRFDSAAREVGELAVNVLGDYLSAVVTFGLGLKREGHA